jgi:predicted SprT family Zn-dependent metalloprotease
MDRTAILRRIEHHADLTWYKFCAIYPELRIIERPVIVPNYRFTKTAANCAVETGTINWGMKFMQRNEMEMLTVIMPHEMAHRIDFVLNGEPKNNRWHGPAWQKIMLKYGLPADPYHTMEI